MAVQVATRTNPPQLRAVRVGAEDSAAIYSLFASITDKYSITTQHDSVFPGGNRITVKRPEYPDQFAYPGDWILVCDADFDPATCQWAVSGSTTVEVWGRSAGLAGTAEEFAATFTMQGS